MTENKNNRVTTRTEVIRNHSRQAGLVFFIPDIAVSLHQFFLSFASCKDLCFICCAPLFPEQEKQLSQFLNEHQDFKIQRIKDEIVPAPGMIGIPAFQEGSATASSLQYLSETTTVSGVQHPLVRLLNTADTPLKILICLKKPSGDDLQVLQNFSAHLLFLEDQVEDTLLVSPEAAIIDMCLPMNEMPAVVQKIQSGKIRLRNRSFQHLTASTLSSTQAERLNQQIDGILWEANASSFEFTYISPQVERILGYTVEEWMKQKDFWQKHIYEDDRESAVNFCHHETLAGRDHVFEYRMMARDGRYVWIHDRVTIEYKNGRPHYLKGLMIDITKEKEFREQLLHEKSLTDLLVQHLPNVFFLFNAEGKFLLWNSKLENISGYSHEEVAQMHPLDFFGEDVKLLIRDNIQLTFEEGYTEIEVPITAKNKTLIPLHFTARQIFYKGQSCVYGVGTDISKVKRAMLELSQMINNTDEAFLLIDTSLHVITFNKRFDTLYREFLGISVRKGDHILDYAEKSKILQLTEMYAQVLKGAEVKNEISLQHTDGSAKTFSVRYKPALNTDREVIGVFITAADITSEKATKEELLLSEQRYKYLFEHNPAPMFIWDFESKQIVDCNDAALIKYGYTREEFLSLTILDIRPAEDVERIKSVTATEEVYTNYGRSLHNDTWRHLKKSGELMEVEVTGHVLEYRGRKATLVLIHDVTIQKQAEEQLKLSEKRFKSLIQDGSDLMAILDLAGNYTYVSPTSVSVLGIEPSQFIGKNAFDFIHPDDKDEVISQFSKLTTDKRISIPAFRFRNNEGEWRWVETIVTNLLDDPAVMGIVANSRDVTEKEQLFGELKASESRYKGFYESQTNFVIRTDMNGNYSYYNKKFEETFGWLYPDGIILGKHCMGSIRDYDHQKAIETVQKCISTPETVYKVELDKPLADGSTLTTLWDFMCVTDVEGNPFEIQCMGIDITERIQFEKSLRESNERYEYINKAANDAIYDWDPANDKFYWGDSFTRIFGHETNFSNFTLDDLAKLVHPNDVEVAQKELAEFLADPTRNSWTFECRLQRADGTYAYIKQIGYLIRDEKGIPKRMIGALRDVSENRELQQLVNNATKLSRIGAWEVDVKRNTLYWSPMTKMIHEVEDDYTPSIQDGIGFYREDVRPEVESIVTKAMTEGGMFDFEMPLITAKGNECWVRAIGEVEMFDGEVIRVFGSFQDIHQMKMAELAIIRSNERFEKVTQATNDAIWDWDITSDQTYLGNGYQTLFGYDLSNKKDNEILKLWSGLIHEEDAALVKQHFKLALESPNIYKWQMEYRYRKANGTFAFVQDKALIIRDENHKAIRMVGAMSDITYRKEYEESLHRLNTTLDAKAKDLAVSNAELEQFAYIASHDLQEPLRMISSFLTQLHKKYHNQLDEKANQYIHFAVDGAKRMRQIILDLLEYSRVGKHDVSLEEIDINEVVNEICLLQRQRILEQSASIEYKDLPVVHSFRVPLTQIFQNLIGNALKYSKTGEKSVILIKGEEQKDRYLFSVADNGIGINKDFHTKVFELFQRLHNRNEYEGTGMGLAIVKKILENLGGKIWVESEEGLGSVFYFTIPKQLR